MPALAAPLQLRSYLAVLAQAYFVLLFADPSQ